MPNLFHRAGRAPLFDLSGLGDPEQRGALFERLVPLIRALTPEVITRHTGAYLDFLADRDDVAPGPVSIVGYCMGGMNALRAIEAYPDRIAALASFHAGRVVLRRQLNRPSRHAGPSRTRRRRRLAHRAHGRRGRRGQSPRV